MPAAPPRKKAAPFGLSTPVLVAGGALLVVVGAAAGIGLDLALRPAPAPHRIAAAPPPRALPRPVIRVPADDEPERPSVLAPRPLEPDAHPEPSPARAAPPAAPAPAITASPEPPVGDQPRLAYAVPADVPAGHAVLAIVIDDMGLDRVRAERVIKLPGPLTVSLMTYADDLPGLVKQARAGGHEVLAHVPMEPRDPKEKPGPRALTVAMDDAAIRATLGADLDSWKGYVGINNHMGSRFTADRARMDVVMTELKARGLLWLDSKTTTDSAGVAAARAAGVPELERDVFLDNIQTEAAVMDELEHAIAAAKSHGSAIAIGHPHDATISVLREMLPRLDARGVTLVPVTEVLKRREAKRGA